MLYKYPQAAFPYERLLEENRRRGSGRAGVRAARHRDLRRRSLLRRVRRVRQGRPGGHLCSGSRSTTAAPTRPTLHVLPQVWFRNTWSWGRRLRQAPAPGGRRRRESAVEHPTLGNYDLHRDDGSPELLFTENETNAAGSSARRPVRATSRTPSTTDVVGGRGEAVNPTRHRDQGGGALPRSRSPAAAPRRSRVRLRRASVEGRGRSPTSTRSSTTRQARGRRVLRRSLQRDIDRRRRAAGAAAGVRRDDLEQAVLPLRRAAVARGRSGAAAAAAERRTAGTPTGRHLNNADIISMPDKWEYPWYAAWDLAFHLHPAGADRPEFAKEQLLLLTREWYMHPNGQLRPTNGPSATSIRRCMPGPPGGCFRSTASSASGKGRPRRSSSGSSTSCCSTSPGGSTARTPRAGTSSRAASSGWTTSACSTAARRCPTGGYIDQADGTGWMAMYCLNLMRIALELAHAQPGLRGHRHQVLRALPATSPRR